MNKGQPASTQRHSVDYVNHVVDNVQIGRRCQKVSYTHFPQHNIYLAASEGLPTIKIVPDGRHWNAINLATEEHLGASLLSTAFDYAILHWWTNFGRN